MELGFPEQGEQDEFWLGLSSRCLCCDLMAEAPEAPFLISSFYLLDFAAINGYVFGNLPEVTMCAGDYVSWHLFGMGNEMDVHTAYFHGETLSIRGHRTDVASLFPATFVTADMIPSSPGRWLLSCQVNDHIQGKAGPPGVVGDSAFCGQHPTAMSLAEGSDSLSCINWDALSVFFFFF